MTLDRSFGFLPKFYSPGQGNRAYSQFGRVASEGEGRAAFGAGDRTPSPTLRKRRCAASRLLLKFPRTRAEVLIMLCLILLVLLFSRQRYWCGCYPCGCGHYPYPYPYGAYTPYAPYCLERPYAGSGRSQQVNSRVIARVATEGCLRGAWWSTRTGVRPRGSCRSRWRVGSS